MDIDSTPALLQADDSIVDILSYDNNGTDTNLNALKLCQGKNLRDFLIDHNNRQELLDPSAFTYDDVVRFITLCGYITRPAQAVVPASVATTAKQVQLGLDDFSAAVAESNFL